MNQRCELQFDNYTEGAKGEAVPVVASRSREGSFALPAERGGEAFPAALRVRFCLPSIGIERSSEFRTQPRIGVRVWSTVKGGVSSRAL